jgi:hypothetical protein
MGFLTSLFGGGEEDTPMPEAPKVEEARRDIDPNMSEGLAEARRTRQQIQARTGRSDLVTSRRTGINIVGDDEEIA